MAIRVMRSNLKAQGHAEGFTEILFDCIVKQICATYQYNCAKNGKGLRIGTKEADTI